MYSGLELDDMEDTSIYTLRFSMDITVMYVDYGITSDNESHSYLVHKKI